MPLSERVRPGCEVAPWVISEIKQLEAEVERLHIVLSALREPSEAVIKAAQKALAIEPSPLYQHHAIAVVVRTAVATVEQEVNA